MIGVCLVFQHPIVLHSAHNRRAWQMASECSLMHLASSFPFPEVESCAKNHSFQPQGYLSVQESAHGLTTLLSPIPPLLVEGEGRALWNAR